MYKIAIYLVMIVIGIFSTGCSRTQITLSDLTPKTIAGDLSISEQTTDLFIEEIEQIEEIDPIEEMIKGMTLDEKIGQLFIIDVQNDTSGNAILAVNEEVKEKIIKYKVGGIILFKGNISTKEQIISFISSMQDLSDIPLFIGVDEEGGKVSRIGQNKDLVEKPFRAAFDIGETGDSKAAYNEAKRMGEVLKKLGFNLNFAPVADIYNNETNTVIGTRSFGKTKEQVIPMVISYAQGLLSEGIQPVLKHFPGHGNTQEDSHEGLAYVNKTQAELEKEELVPFIEAVNESIDMIMTGHLIVKDIDEEYPVTLSRKWFDYMHTLFNTTEILFITDAMNMGAIIKNYGTEDAIVRSFLAGNDILLMPKDVTVGIEAIRDAYAKGVITGERLDHSVRKILSKKVERNILVLE